MLTATSSIANKIYFSIENRTLRGLLCIGERLSLCTVSAARLPKLQRSICMHGNSHFACITNWSTLQLLTSFTVRDQSLFAHGAQEEQTWMLGFSYDAAVGGDQA